MKELTYTLVLRTSLAILVFSHCSIVVQQCQLNSTHCAENQDARMLCDKANFLYPSPTLPTFPTNLEGSREGFPFENHGLGTTSFRNKIHNRTAIISKASVKLFLCVLLFSANISTRFISIYSWSEHTFTK